MNRAGKVLAITSAVLVGVAVAAWAGMFFYWHVRITGAIRDLESAAGQSDLYEHRQRYGRAFTVLEQARCRSLPYLVNTMDPSKQEWILITVQYHIQMYCRGKDWQKDMLKEWEEQFVTGVRPGPPDIGWGDPPARVRVKCDQQRAWWKESGHKYHQWWRIWSSSCRDAKEGR